MTNEAAITQAEVSLGRPCSQSSDFRSLADLAN